MSAKLVSVEGAVIKIEVTMELSESMLESEIKIQEKLNEAGRIARKEALKQQDTDGSVLEIEEK
ncbi:MAG: ISKra4 family transposase, partial [Pseudanabaena sp. ELA748]